MVIQHGWGPDDSPTVYYYGNAVCTTLTMALHLTNIWFLGGCAIEGIGIMPGRLMCSHDLVGKTFVKGFIYEAGSILALRSSWGRMK